MTFRIRVGTIVCDLCHHAAGINFDRIEEEESARWLVRRNGWQHIESRGEMLDVCPKCAKSLERNKEYQISFFAYDVYVACCACRKSSHYYGNHSTALAIKLAQFFATQSGWRNVYLENFSGGGWYSLCPECYKKHAAGIDIFWFDRDPKRESDEIFNKED